MTDVAIVGFGAIGKRVAALLREGGGRGRVATVLLRPGSAAAGAAEGAGLRVVTDPAALLSSGPGLVVECAGQEALAAHGPALLGAGVDLVAASIGALADAALERALKQAAQRSGAALLLPAGAVGGIDALAAMRLAGLERVTYRSRKPPAAWAGSPAEDLVDLTALTEPAVFYRGAARAAAARFPKNANVAATVALAGLGFEATAVELVADPGSGANVHEIEAEGASGRFSIRLEGRPDPDNPRTSALTALSLVRAVRNHLEAWRI